MDISYIVVREDKNYKAVVLKMISMENGLSKQLAAKWNAMNEEQKKPYEIKADKGKKQHVDDVKI